ncbi:HlyD family efflux transporter periplasmic adaptor subunit [Staphylococcus hominis]
MQKRNFYLQYNTQIKYPPITSTNKFNLSNDILNLQQQLQTRIYAPIKGRVTVLQPFPSKSHTEIMQINNDERIIRAKIKESQLKQLKNNQLVQVSIKNTRQFEGKILSISSIPYKTETSSSFYYVDIYRSFLPYWIPF